MAWRDLAAPREESQGGQNATSADNGAVSPKSDFRIHTRLCIPLTMTANRSFFSGVARALALGFAVLGSSGATFLASAPAHAQVSTAQIVQGELRHGWRTERGTHMAALHLRLADGWKTYWRIPGEAGIAPRLDWSRSQNVASVIAHWPRPIVFDQNGFRSIGYSGELILPLEFTPRTDGRPMALMAQITIGVCNETCVPVDLTLSMPLRGAGAPDPFITAALSRRAEGSTGAGLTRATCRVEPGESGAELTLRAALPRLGAHEHLVVELPGTEYWVSDSQTWREGGELVARARVRAPARGAVSIDRSSVAFTILTDDRMVVHQGCTGN